MISQLPTRKTRAKRRKNHYFTKVHEDAIIRYAQTTCIKERTDLYVNYIVITKNWFIHKVKRQQKRNKREVDFDNIAKHYEEEYLSTDDSYLKDREVAEFWNTFYTELDSWDESQMKDNDLRVYKAINILFESKDDIEIFNKKAIYLYLREITGLNTKQIVNSLKKFRKKYTNFKIDWENGEL